ncbi:hypothetical protein XENOCAPTIV_020629 [Xenoophorus captivus]|uniref:Uncharacterized protein n=1 Tax=Xenoophorus captivus TaxID=1517983 RepID=A0ABV0Q3Z0_9TELE
MACSGGQSNAETLEGFHEVNLASPTTPDLQNQTEQRPPARHSTAPTSVYRTHSLGPPPGGLPTSLRADQLPTQPVYSTPRHSHNGSVPGLEAEPAEGSVLSGEDGDECTALSDSLSRQRSPSVMEVREKGYERLKDELAKAQRLGQELEELTASLFQIDVLQAEVQALKTLVLSSPTSPVAELPSAGATKTPFKKGHSRNKSTSSAMLGTQPDPTATQPIVRECREVDSQLFSEFKAWKEAPTLDRSCSFLERVYREDIFPCLTFNKSEVHILNHQLLSSQMSLYSGFGHPGSRGAEHAQRGAGGFPAAACGQSVGGGVRRTKVRTYTFSLSPPLHRTFTPSSPLHLPLISSCSGRRAELVT